MDLSISKTSKPKNRPDENKLGFGTYFTDHMFLMDYSKEKGWHNARITPYGSLSMDPSTMVFHYGQAIFEGLKAYRTAENKIQLFRPEANLERLNSSARRLCIPPIDEAFGLECLKKLVELESEWVPRPEGTSLYIRPTVIATDPFLGVRASFTYTYFIILSPVGAYYPEGFAPVKIWVTTSYVRAVPGGVGETKTAGNYAASLYAGEKAHENGYTQVLWLDGVERRYVEEVGAMNIFFVIDGELITPSLSGSILPGVTRDSVLKLARHWNMKVSERRISIDEVMEAHEKGKLDECFGTGTAAVISPVGELRYKDKVIKIGDGSVGPVANKFYKAITDIQYGRSSDPFNWIVPV